MISELQSYELDILCHGSNPCYHCKGNKFGWKERKGNPFVWESRHCFGSAWYRGMEKAERMKMKQTKPQQAPHTTQCLPFCPQPGSSYSQTC